MTDFPEMTVSLVSARLGRLAVRAQEELALVTSMEAQGPHFQVGYLKGLVESLVARLADSSSELAEAYEALVVAEEREADPRAC